MSISEDTWGMSEERAFLENLLCDRFNFLFVFFSAAAGFGITIIDRKYFLQLYLFICTSLAFLISLTTYRTQHKLNIALKHLSVEQPNHPHTVIEKEVKGRSVRNIIGFIIPTICWLTLFIALICSILYLPQQF